MKARFTRAKTIQDSVLSSIELVKLSWKYKLCREFDVIVQRIILQSGRVNMLWGSLSEMSRDVFNYFLQ